MNVVSRIRRAASTTPGLYRLASIALALLLVLSAAIATLAANRTELSSRRLKANTAPVLVATQTLLASLAEADAAATAAYLSGADEDREQRRLYEEALARATAQSEEISALIGDDESAHDTLKQLGLRINRYAGLIEAARATQRSGAAESAAYLLRGLDEIAAAVAGDAAQLTRLSEERLDRDTDRSTVLFVAAAGLGLLAFLAIVGVSAVVTRRSRRVINPLLLVALLITGASTTWLIVTAARTANDITEAREDGYESIALTAEIQAAAFGGKTSESIALISGDVGSRADADASIARLTSRPIDASVADAVRAGTPPDTEGLFFTAAREADSARERAAVAEMLVRWQRYADTVVQLRATTGDPARAIAVGPASSTFNGFNFSVESVLADNRDQFLTAIADAEAKTSWLSSVTLLLPLLAALAALGGLQVRINEYR